MEKSKIIIISLIAIVVLGGGVFAFSNNNSDMAMKKDTANSGEEMMVKDESAMESDDLKEQVMMKDNASGYVEYSKSALDSAKDTRRVLFFYASWCPTCRPTDTNISDNVSQIPEDVLIIRVNYNDPDTDSEEKELARKYGVTYQHTFVQIDSEGNEVVKWNGGQLEELLTKIK